MVKRKYKIKKKIRRKYKKNAAKVLDTDFNFYIFQVNSGVNQCNETKKNYAMMKLSVPKRVNLPNGRTFVARYKRIARDQLPPNIVMRRTYTQRAAPSGRTHRQRGRGIFDFVKKFAGKLLVKSIARKDLEYTPGLYHNLTKRIKNKTLKRILNSGTAHLALNKAIKTADNRLR